MEGHKLMIELVKALLGINEDYPENDRKEITLAYCPACGWLDAMAYRFYLKRNYKINRKKVHSHAEPAVQK